MEIGPLKRQCAQPGVAPALPIRDNSRLHDRLVLASDKEKTYREEADQLNQLAQLARMRGYR